MKKKIMNNEKKWIMKKKDKKWINAKITVSQVASDKKRNWHMAKTFGFLETLSPKPLPSRLRRTHRGLCGVLCLLLVEASAESTHWTQRHMTDVQTYDLPKMIPWYSSNNLTGRAWLFLLDIYIYIYIYIYGSKYGNESDDSMKKIEKQCIFFSFLQLF